MVATTLRICCAAAAATIALAYGWESSTLNAPDHRWVVVATPALCLLVAWTLPVMRRQIRQAGVVPMALATATAAVYGCVPETDHIPPVAVCAAAVVIAEVITWHPLPTIVIAAAGTWVLAAGLFGATGRQSALVGTLFAMWAFVCLPFVAWLHPGVNEAPEPVRWLIAGAGSLSCVAVARTGALRSTITPALVAAGVAVVATIVVALAVVQIWERVVRRDSAFD